jgi:phage baseplate assembly protein W
MLTIKDTDGVDLIINPPEDARYRVTGEDATAHISVVANIIEDNPFLAGMYVSGTLDWNDGSLPTVYNPASGTLAINGTKSLENGDYIVSVYGNNYRSPTNDQVRVNFPIKVVQQQTKAAPPHLIFGPIVPRDSGSPNANDWMFNTDSDLLILESSVKMLLLTAKGERLMEPNYGTNLRRILFEMNINGVESMVQEEIVSALTTWEPRLQLETISVKRNGATAVSVAATFLSKLSTQSFAVNLEFVR